MSDNYEYISGQAWQLHQRLAHDEYVGSEPDIDQLRRDLMHLSMLVHQLSERFVETERQVG